MSEIIQVKTITDAVPFDAIADIRITQKEAARVLNVPFTRISKCVAMGYLRTDEKKRLYLGDLFQKDMTAVKGNKHLRFD